MAHQPKRTKTGGYLISLPCPKCSKTAEHSAARVNKRKNLICPFCSTLFLPSDHSHAQ
ncbi:YnfU family zinc-binding protein [Shimwellia pseudoproteus]|uniref:YnfU family zinc-binding protein n=1 Tax=Shimwellia pseudoproteus TaxID=570012 RepID=UPI001E3DA1E6|nr:YnfU family zinc-binding protein [Shimwellia pseudoproteus]